MSETEWAEVSPLVGGYVSQSKSICLAHINDQGLRTEVLPYLTLGVCSFCETAGPLDRPVAADFDSFMQVVMGAVTFFYARANPSGSAQDGAGVTHEDGEWLFSSDEVIDEILGSGDDFVDTAVLECVKEAIVEDAWTESDFLVLREDERLQSNWQSFGEFVKYESRYFFLEGESEDSNPTDMTAGEFFRQLADYIQGIPGVVQNIPPGTPIFRGRMVASSADPATYRARELGPTPRRKATANRMSPAGISMFYGCNSVQTVVAEIGAHSSRSHAMVGRFYASRPLKVVDLSALPDVPSIFDSTRRNYYYGLRFLHEFAKDLARPVEVDGQEHIDYVPTQIVTEYMRRAAKLEVDGIKYQSAQANGWSVVLFCEQSSVVDEGDEDDGTWLKLESMVPKKFRVVASINNRTWP